MKTVAVCVFCALGAFVVAHLHMSGQLGDIDDYDVAGPAKVEETPTDRALGPDGAGRTGEVAGSDCVDEGNHRYL